MRRYFRLSLIFCFTLLASCQQHELVIQQPIISFGTVINIQIAVDASKQKVAQDSIAQIEQLLNQRHQQWHAWQDGELQQLNQQLREKKRATTSQDLLLLIQLSQRYYTLSDGLFNPALGKLIAAWGFHANKQPDKALIERIVKDIPTMDNLTLHNKTVQSSHPMLQLDFGGIAKGLAILQIKEVLKQQQLKHYLINIGGDLYASGNKHGKAWVAGIQNPFAKTALATLDITHASSLFSSGNYQRFYQDNQQHRHHIIDPRTGYPSEQASAVTVLHNDPITADVAATALMIAAQHEWSKISQQLGIKDYLIINDRQEIWSSQSLFDKTTFNTDLKIHIIPDKPL